MPCSQPSHRRTARGSPFASWLERFGGASADGPPLVLPERDPTSSLACCAMASQCVRSSMHPTAVAQTTSRKRVKLPQARNDCWRRSARLPAWTSLIWARALTTFGSARDSADSPSIASSSRKGARQHGHGALLARPLHAPSDLCVELANQRMRQWTSIVWPHRGRVRGCRRGSKHTAHSPRVPLISP